MTFLPAQWFPPAMPFHCIFLKANCSTSSLSPTLSRDNLNLKQIISK